MEPPGPIPNPEVKRRSADGSGTIGPVRVGRRQVYAPSMETWTGLFFCPDHPETPPSRGKAGQLGLSEKNEFAVPHGKKGAYNFRGWMNQLEGIAVCIHLFRVALGEL